MSVRDQLTAFRQAAEAARMYEDQGDIRYLTADNVVTDPRFQTFIDTGQYTPSGDAWPDAEGPGANFGRDDPAPVSGGGEPSQAPPSAGPALTGWFGENSPNPANFGAPPEPFSETYTALERPAWLQGQYQPLQWTGGDFAAPEKPEVLRTPYALPTQADLEASPGYLAGQTAMQRGMERSAAAKGSILSGGFVGRALPRAMGEYAGGAYQNLVGNTLSARGQQFGEYSTDVNQAFNQYQQRYGQFSDAANRDVNARGVNESAFATDSANTLQQYGTRLNTYLANTGVKRTAENDLFNRNATLSDLGLRAAALARP